MIVAEPGSSQAGVHERGVFSFCCRIVSDEDCSQSLGVVVDASFFTGTAFATNLAPALLGVMLLWLVRGWRE